MIRAAGWRWQRSRCCGVRARRAGNHRATANVSRQGGSSGCDGRASGLGDRARSACQAGADRKYRKGGFQGIAFASVLTSCAFCRGKITHDRSRHRDRRPLFRAVLGDFQEVGDGAGGEKSSATTPATRCASLRRPRWRTTGCTTPRCRRGRYALARTVQAWADWYQTKVICGCPGASYHAGYAFGPAMIAIARRAARRVGSATRCGATRSTCTPDRRRDRQAACSRVKCWPEGWRPGLRSSVRARRPALADKVDACRHFARGRRPDGPLRPRSVAGSRALVRRRRHRRARAHIATCAVLYAVIAGVAADGVKAWARADWLARRIGRRGCRSWPRWQRPSRASAPMSKRAATSYLAAGSGSCRRSAGAERSGWSRTARRASSHPPAWPPGHSAHPRQRRSDHRPDPVRLASVSPASARRPSSRRSCRRTSAGQAP